jgi:hypothetical protein
MHDPVRNRRRTRDAGLAAVDRWTRRAVAGGVVLSGLLAAGLAHLLPGQAAVVRHDTPAPAGTTAPVPSATQGDSGDSEDSGDSGDSEGSGERTRRPTTLAPPSAAPRPTHRPPHATSGGS